MVAQAVSADWRFQLSLTALSGLLTLGGVYWGARLAFAHQAQLRRDERQAQSLLQLAEAVARLGRIPQALQVNGIDSIGVLDEVIANQSESLSVDMKVLTDVNARECVYVAFSLVRHIDLVLDMEEGTEWIKANWSQLSQLSGYCQALSNALFERSNGRPADLPTPIHTGSAYGFFAEP